MIEDQLIQNLVKSLKAAYTELKRRKEIHVNKEQELKKQVYIEQDQADIVDDHIRAVCKAYKAITGADMPE